MKIMFADRYCFKTQSILSITADAPPRIQFMESSFLPGRILRPQQYRIWLVKGQCSLKNHVIFKHNRFARIATLDASQNVTFPNV